MSVNGKILATMIVFVLEAIDESGVPEGTLYAALMNYLGLDHFNGLMRELKTLNAVSISSHYITRGGNYSEVLGMFKVIEKTVDKKE